MNRKIIKSVHSAISALLLTASVLAFSSCSVSKKTYPEMTVTFMGMGKADAIVIATENHTVLVDAANKGDGKDIYEYCSSLDRTSLDCFILTHFDKDHVGGAKAVISKFDSIARILQPGYEETNNEYEKYVSAYEEKGISPEVLTETVSFALDDAVFTVYPPEDETYSQTNNYSLAVTVEYGEKAFLLAGDAEKVRIKELISQIPARKEGYDVVKMPHHGQAQNNTDDFVLSFMPSATVITCSEKEPADDETIEILKGISSEIYYADKENIVFTCDGYTVNAVTETEETS